MAKLSRKEVECFKKTTDNFRPNYAGDYVNVVLRALDPKGERWRIGVWGEDDYALVWDQSNYADAKSMFFTVCQMETVTEEALRKFGFVSF